MTNQIPKFSSTDPYSSDGITEITFNNTYEEIYNDSSEIIGFEFVALGLNNNQQLYIYDGNNDTYTGIGDNYNNSNGIVTMNA